MRIRRCVETKAFVEPVLVKHVVTEGRIVCIMWHRKTICPGGSSSDGSGASAECIITERPAPAEEAIDRKRAACRMWHRKTTRPGRSRGWAERPAELESQVHPPGHRTLEERAAQGIGIARQLVPPQKHYLLIGTKLLAELASQGTLAPGIIEPLTELASRVFFRGIGIAIKKCSRNWHREENCPRHWHRGRPSRNWHRDRLK